MYEWIVYQGYQPIIIATKFDKINRSQKDKHINMLRKGINAPGTTKIIPFSALSKQGRDEIWDCIEEVLLAHTGSEEIE